jgi:type I restriction enzyme R subunit
VAATGLAAPEPGDRPPWPRSAASVVVINPQGRFILCPMREGRDTAMIPVDEYRREVIQRVLSPKPITSTSSASCGSKRRSAANLIDHLLGDNFSPDVIREIDQMTDFDLYDFFGHHGYHARALKRPERGALYISE